MRLKYISFSCIFNYCPTILVLPILLIVHTLFAYTDDQFFAYTDDRFIQIINPFTTKLSLVNSQVIRKRNHILVSGNLRWWDYSIFPNGAHLHVVALDYNNYTLEAKIYKVRRYRFLRTPTGQRKLARFNIRLYSSMEFVSKIILVLKNQSHNTSTSIMS